MWFVLHNLVLDCQQRSLVAKMFEGGDHWPRKNDDRHQISRFVDARFGNRGWKSCKIKHCGLSCGFHICDIKNQDLWTPILSNWFSQNRSNVMLKIWIGDFCLADLKFGNWLATVAKTMLWWARGRGEGTPNSRKISAAKLQYCFDFNALAVSMGAISNRHGKYICATFSSPLSNLDSGNYCGAKKNLRFRFLPQSSCQCIGSGMPQA